MRNPQQHVDYINTELTKRVKAAVEALFPITSSNGKTIVTASQVEVDLSAFESLTNEDHQNARIQAKSLTAPIYATLTLERDGKTVQTRNRAKIGDLPLMTSLLSFHVKGNDYFTPSQLLLKPGVYVQSKSEGRVVANINAEGGGAKMSVTLDPAKGTFKFGRGTTNVALFPILNYLGVSDEAIQRALGGDERAAALVRLNKVKKPEKELLKLVSAIVSDKQDKKRVAAGLAPLKDVPDDQAAQIVALKQMFEKSKLDPYVTRKTVGTSDSTLSPMTLLGTARKALFVHRGDAQEDVPDELHYHYARGIEEHLPLKITRGKFGLTKDVRHALNDSNVTLGKAIKPDWLNKVTFDYFGGGGMFGGGIAHTAETPNPLAMISEAGKFTLGGEGGIQSTHAITNEARLFRPSSMGFIDPTHTPEGSEIGVTTHLSGGAIKAGREVRAALIPVKDGIAGFARGRIDVAAEVAADSVVGYEDEWDRATGKPKADMVRAVRDGNVQYVSPSEVQYLVSPGLAFDPTTAYVSFLQNTHSNRAMMAGKHVSQALPLVNRELPRVKVVDPDTKETTGQTVARPFVVRSTVSGKVGKVDSKEIIVAGVSHKLFDQYPTQAKVAITHLPVVKVGDIVKAGDLLADTNYTRDGELALGVNIRTMHSPWRNGLNYEDAIVVSESASKKLTSEHLHRAYLRKSPDLRIDPGLFRAQFPTALTNENAAVLDASGIVKPGAKVSPGFVLITAVREKKIDELDRTAKALASIHKTLMKPYSNSALVWDEEFQGEVVRVANRPDGYEVHIKTQEPLRVGDKLSMGSAAKGTVSVVMPDDQMPRQKNGDHIEAIFNPHGIPGRINPSQSLEQAAGKLFEKTGKRYEISPFDGVDHAAKLKEALAEHGLSHAEVLFDPVSGRDIERAVGTGVNYVFKLDHPVRKKFSARARDSYTMDDEPTRGKGISGQSYDHLTTYAHMGHDAHAILQETFGIKGAKNDEFWHAYQAGLPLPAPVVPAVFEKFRHYLRGAGVDTDITGDAMSISTLTDKKVLELSNGAIENPRQIIAKNMAEEKGGLFDVKITGGLKGENYAHIDLGQAMPHPLYESVIRDLTGLKEAELRGLIGGTKFYDTAREKIVDAPTNTTLTGEAAFKKLLSFDVGAKMKETKRRLETAVGSDRNRYHRVTQYLRGLEKTGHTPAEAYLTSKIAVIPPKFRGIEEQADGQLRVAPSNLLYRDLIMMRDTLRSASRDGTLPASDIAKARVGLYDAVGAVVGTVAPLTKKFNADELPGFVKVIKGKSSKEGLFQQHLSRRRSDYTGRSTIEPDASLSANQIALPDPMLWKIYEPAIVRDMVQRGWKPADAMQEVKNKSPAARQTRQGVMERYPVLYNRAPSLHRWNVLAAYPRVAEGQEIKLSPAVIGGHNADFDGDTMAVHVPLTEPARLEAQRLLPERNLYYDRDRSLVFGPEKDMIAGIFALTRPGRPSGKSFDSPQDAIAAYYQNKDNLMMNSIVQVKGVQGQPTIGWLVFRSIIPDRFLAGIVPPITRKTLDVIMDRVAKEAPGQFVSITRKLTMAGFDFAARAGGITATIDELVLDRTKAKRLLDQFEKELKKVPAKDRTAFAVNYSETVLKPEMMKIVDEHYKDREVGFGDIQRSGSSSKAKFDQFQQILLSPVLTKDHNNNVTPVVIKTSYGAGMGLADYLLTTPGARSGLVDRSLATSKPGYMAKQIAALVGPVRVGENDCGTLNGLEVPLAPPPGVKDHDVDLLDRHLLRGVAGTPFKRNDVVTSAMLSTLRSRNVPSIWVRSPMTCQAKQPPCSMCAGRKPDGELHPVGSNIGYNYGQSVSERGTQLTMRTFHSGGTIGAGHGTSGFARVNEILSDTGSIRDQGELAPVDGRVTKAAPAPQGGFNVDITAADGEVHEIYVGAGRTLKVKQGDRVAKGDFLCDGNYRPTDIARFRGNLEAQKYMVDEIRKAYQEAGAIVRKPVLEVVAAASARWVEIVNDGGEKDIAPGDVIHENAYEELRKKNPKIMAQPVIPGLNRKVAMTSDDLLERLNFRDLEDSMADVAAMGGTSDLTGSKGSPIAGLAYGANFRPGQRRL